MNIIESFNACSLLESVKINYKNRHNWIDKDLKNYIKKRERLYLLTLYTVWQKKILIRGQYLAVRGSHILKLTIALQLGLNR